MPGLELALPALSQWTLAQASCPGAGVQAQAGTGGHRLSLGGWSYEGPAYGEWATWGFKGTRGAG